jgi:lipopolysaccharide export system protein LptA
MDKRFLIIGLVLALSMIFSAHFCLADNIIIEANKQKYNEKDNMTHFEGNVKVTTKDMEVKGPKAIMKIGANNKPEYALFTNNPIATKNTPTSKSKIKANIMRLSLIDNTVKAEGNVFSEVINSMCNNSFTACTKIC